MKQKKKVSIIVPVYNSEKYLEKCLSSIINQTYQNIEIIIIDDGSKDNSYAICKQYAHIDKRITIDHQDNKGASSARNKGIEMATGNYLLFVDSDDWIEKEMVEKLLAKCEENLADVVVFGWKCENEQQQKHRPVSVDTIFKWTEVVEKIIQSNTELGGGYICNKIWNIQKIDKKCMRFDERLYSYEDKVWTIENYKICDTILEIPDIYYHYNVHEGSLSHKGENNWEQRRNSVLAFQVMSELLKDNEELYNKAVAVYFKEITNNLAHSVKRHNVKYMKVFLDLITEYKAKVLDLKGVSIHIKLKAWSLFLITRFILIGKSDEKN